MCPLKPGEQIEEEMEIYSGSQVKNELKVQNANAALSVLAAASCHVRALKDKKKTHVGEICPCVWLAE